MPNALVLLLQMLRICKKAGQRKTALLDLYFKRKVYLVITKNTANGFNPGCTPPEMRFKKLMRH